MKEVEKWLQKHFHFRKEEEFVIFVVWAAICATLLVSYVVKQ